MDHGGTTLHFNMWDKIDVFNWKLSQLFKYFYFRFSINFTVSGASEPIAADGSSCHWWGQNAGWCTGPHCLQKWKVYQKLFHSRRFYSLHKIGWAKENVRLILCRIIFILKITFFNFAVKLLWNWGGEGGLETV